MGRDAVPCKCQFSLLLAHDARKAEVVKLRYFVGFSFEETAEVLGVSVPTVKRDIKPSNILVTLHDGVPLPKVIDFGVAKAIQSQRLMDLTFFTRFEQRIGTPLYMSPEQAEMSGLDIDTRSDIYSLGVLLYELLTGKTSF